MMSSALETPDASPETSSAVEDRLDGILREPKRAAPGKRLDEDLTRRISDFVHHEDQHDPEKRTTVTLAAQTVPVYVSFLKSYISYQLNPIQIPGRI
jgi:hypothetical protein